MPVRMRIVDMTFLHDETETLGQALGQVALCMNAWSWERVFHPHEAKHAMKGTFHYIISKLGKLHHTGIACPVIISLPAYHFIQPIPPCYFLAVLSLRTNTPFFLSLLPRCKRSR